MGVSQAAQICIFPGKRYFEFYSYRNRELFYHLRKKKIVLDCNRKVLIHVMHSGLF